MAIGPVQLIVLGFDKPDFHGEIIEELEKLRETDTVRVIDSLAVYRDAEGEIEVMHLSNLTRDEAIELGSKVAALIGLGIDGEEGFKAGAEAGAELVTGGRRSGQRGFFVEPTIFDRVKDDMAIARDEIFGPVVSILPFRGVEDVIERANRTYYGLAAAVWTRDINKAHLFARGVKAGTVWVNCYHVVDTTTPFGGFKLSGHGRENGEAALEHYTEVKTVTVKLG